MQNYQKQLESKMKEQQKKQQIEEVRQTYLSQILTPQAKDRLNKIKLVKPQKATGIQNSLIQTAQSGRLQNKITEKQLVQLLQKQSEKKVESKITFKRRGLDDDW